MTEKTLKEKSQSLLFRSVFPTFMEKIIAKIVQCLNPFYSGLYFQLREIRGTEYENGYDMSQSLLFRSVFPTE